jgi:RimJ/RimL family protein N-acetyltransferase
MYNPYVVGKYVYLRHPTKKDAVGKWHEWFSDEETTKYLVDRFWPNSKEAQLEYLKSLKDKNRLNLAIVTKSDDEHIGVVSLSSINWVHRYADVTIILGEKKYQKGVYALEAFSLILKIAFLRLNLRTIKSGFVNSNITSKTMHRVFKFAKVGVYKNLFSIDGHYDDLIVAMLDRESWLKRNKLNNKET